MRGAFSEGGKVAFMLAAQSKVDFVISMAGSALKLGDVLDMQLREQLLAAGMSGKVLENELAAPKDRMTIKSYPKLNHLFQHCKTGAPTEYGQIDETMALEVLEDIAGFVGNFGGEKAKMCAAPCEDRVR